MQTAQSMALQQIHLLTYPHQIQHQNWRQSELLNVIFVNKKKFFSFFLVVQFPISEKLSAEDVYERRTGKPRSEVLKDHFIKEGRIEEEAALRIINGILSNNRNSIFF